MAVRWSSIAIIVSLACSSAFAATSHKHKTSPATHKASASSSAHRSTTSHANAASSKSSAKLRTASYATTGSTSSSKTAAARTSSSKKKKNSKSQHTKREPMPKAPTSDRISEVQTALSRGGYYKTDPNGKWDADTVDAVQRFQGANGLGTNGKLDALTLQKLGLGSDVAGVSAPKGITPHSCCSMSPSPSLAPPPAPPPTSLKQAPQAPPPPANALTSSTSSTQP